MLRNVFSLPTNDIIKINHSELILYENDSFEKGRDSNIFSSTRMIIIRFPNESYQVNDGI